MIQSEKPGHVPYSSNFPNGELKKNIQKLWKQH